MVETSPKEVRDEVHEIVKQFFDRHRDELKTYGDAMGFLHDADYEDLRQEAGSIGQSQFSTDIIWLTGMFGPDAEIDYDSLKPKQKKPVPDYIPPEPEPEPEEKPKAKKRGRPKKAKAKKTGPTNALGDVVTPKTEPKPETETEVTEQPKRPVRRKGMRVPPGALGEE